MTRLDVLLLQRGLVSSRQRAKNLITNGQIQVDGVVCTKPAKLTEETSHQSEKVNLQYFRNVCIHYG